MPPCLVLDGGGPALGARHGAEGLAPVGVIELLAALDGGEDAGVHCTGSVAAPALLHISEMLVAIQMRRSTLPPSR